MTVTTAPSVDSNDNLLAAFRALPGRSDDSLSDLYQFLVTPSDARTSFLEANCEFDSINTDSLTIIQFNAR